VCSTTRWYIHDDILCLVVCVQTSVRLRVRVYPYVTCVCARAAQPNWPELCNLIRQRPLPRGGTITCDRMRRTLHMYQTAQVPVLFLSDDKDEPTERFLTMRTTRTRGTHTWISIEAMCTAWSCTYYANGYTKRCK